MGRGFFDKIKQNPREPRTDCGMGLSGGGYIHFYDLARCCNVFTLPFSLLRLKCEKALTAIIERREQAHAHQHRNIISHSGGSTVQQMQTQRFCDTIRQQIADRDIEGKAHNLLPAFLLVPESEKLIQKETENAR